MELSVTLIGLGKMGRALVKGLHAADSNVHLRGVVRRPALCAALEQDLQIPVSSDLAGSTKDADVIVLCTRPVNIPEVCEHLESLASVSSSTVIVSVAAGVSVGQLERMLGSVTGQVIRAMPNTLCEVRQGMTLLCVGTRTTESSVNAVHELFSFIGKAMILDERNMDAGTALSASGPAFAYTFMEAMAQAGVKLGLTSKTAMEMISQCLIGSGVLAQRTGLHPAVLREEVTTPGGCTIAGILALEDRAFRSVVSAAVITAASVAGKLAAPPPQIDTPPSTSQCPARRLIGHVSASTLVEAKSATRTGPCSPFLARD